MNYISNGKYKNGLQKLRELSHMLEELEAKAENIPAGQRHEIDTSSEKLDEKKRLIVLLMGQFEDAAPTERRDLKFEIDSDLEELGRGIENLGEMIDKAEKK